jgi:hypothetical protein
VPSSLVKQSNKNARNTYLPSYTFIRNCVVDSQGWDPNILFRNVGEHVPLEDERGRLS